MSGGGTFANDGDAANLQAQMAMMWCCRHRNWAAGVAVAAGGVTVASNGDDDGCGSEKGSVAGSGEGGVGHDERQKNIRRNNGNRFLVYLPRKLRIEEEKRKIQSDVLFQKGFDSL